MSYNSPCDIGSWVGGVGGELDVTAPVETVKDRVAWLRWSTSREVRVTVDPVARDASACDVGGVGEDENGVGDEMGDRFYPDAFDTWTRRDSLVVWETNERASPVASRKM